MADKLEFSLGLGVDMTGFEKEWKDKEKEIQKLIDSSAFKIKLQGVEGLDKIRAQLKEIQQLQQNFSKPLTGAQALREQLKHEERARLSNAKAMEFEAGSADRLRRQKAQAELTELRLARAKEKSVKATNAQTQAYRMQTGVLNGLKQFMNSYISLLGGYRLMSNIKQITSEFELQRVSLRAITQDAAFADALFAKIKATATESPFSSKDLVTYTKQLAAYRIENEQLYGTMNMLADVSAGLGVSMDRLILAYGQVKAASVLRGTELRQFTEAGIPLVDELAKKFSQLRGEVVSTGEVFDLISTRQVPFEMVADIFKEMTAEGGRFYEMQKKQSESLYGVFENLKDNIQNAYDEIGQSNRGLLMGIGKVATAVAKNLSGITATLTPLVAAWGAYAVSMRLVGNQSSRLAATNALLIKAEQSLNATMNATNTTRARASILIRQAAAAHDRYTFALAKAAAANNVFTRSLYKLKAALVANPITAIFTAIAAVVTGGITLWNRYLNSLSSTDKAHKRSAEYIEAIEKPMKNVNAQYDRLMKRIKEYDILIQTQGKSLSELKKIYPELFNQYSTDAERQEAVNTAMKERVALINELKSLAPEQLSNINAETASVEQLALAWQDVTEEQRKAQLQSLEAKKGELEELIRITRDRKVDIASAGTEEGIIGGIMSNKVNEEAISGYQKQLDVIQKQIDSLTKANQDAAAAQLLWRKEYNRFMKGDTLKDHELAALNFADTIKETRDAWKDATDRAKEYQDAIDAAKTQEQTADVRKNVEEYKKQLAVQQQIIKNAENYAAFAGFSLQTGGKADTSPLDTLKSEVSLIEKIYKRYGELRQLMLDESAKADIQEIYGGLTSVDFLEPDGFKDRLRKMLKKAEALGEKGKPLAMEIALKIQDVDLNEIKNNLESALNKLSQQIKQQQDASEFFEKMLGLTGDVELSTRLALAVTGVTVSDEGIGGLFSQKLAEVLAQEPVAVAVPTDFQIEGDWNVDNIQRAINSGKVTVAQIRDVIENLRATGKKDLAKTLEESLDQLSNYSGNALSKMYDVLKQYDAIEQQRINITSNANNQIKALEDGLVEAAKSMSDEELSALRERTKKAIEGINAAAKLELFKLEDDYIRFFTSIYSMSVENAVKMKDKIREQLYETFAKGGIGIEELRRQLRALDAQFEKLEDRRSLFGSYLEGGVDKLISKYKELGENISDVGARISQLDDPSKISSDDKSYVDSLLQKFKPKVDGKSISSYDELAEVADGQTEKMGSIVQNLGQGMQTAAQGVSGALMIVDRVIKDVHATITGIQGLIDQLNEVRSDDNKVGDWFKYISDFDKYAFSGWEKLKSGDVIGAVFDTVSSIVSIFNNAQRDKVKRLNKEIENQADIIRDLEHAYTRLQEAQEGFVGSDWVRNQQQQLQNLQKQIEATRKQIEAERAKGKSSEKDAIQDYEDTLLDLEAQYREAQRSIVEEMSGTNLGSAVKDLAKTWLDAYLSFEDTMGSVKSSFKDMMSSLVQNSMMAKLVQKRLEPVFEAIDKAYEDAELTPAEWQSIMDMGNEAIKYIDEDLTHLAEMLGLRQQLGSDESGNLTGIAKGVAQASEETVLTLAGYANSLLYYQIWLKNDVAAIRAILEGKVAAVSPAPAGEGGFNVGQLISLQQQSLTQLQAINANTGRSADSLSRLEDKIDSIISTAGTSSRKVVNTRLSN